MRRARRLKHGMRVTEIKGSATKRRLLRAMFIELQDRNEICAKRSLSSLWPRILPELSSIVLRHKRGFELRDRWACGAERSNSWFFALHRGSAWRHDARVDSIYRGRVCGFRGPDASC